MVHHGDVNDHHQAHGVARGVQACPVVINSEGRRGRHDHRLAWHAHSALVHVIKTVEVMAPLGPQLWPELRPKELWRTTCVPVKA
jgi:hypothetical protein